MTNKINLNDTPLWEKLALEELGEKVHPGRKQGYFLAREALREALKSLGHSVSIQDLRLVNYKELIQHSEYTISLSHTPTWGAAIIADKTTYRSVGIDIEDEKRVVKEMIKERIAHPLDIPLKNLELWCLKEAAFKSIMNTGLFEKPIEFSDIEIQNQKWLYSPQNLSGKWELEIQHGQVIARAWIKN